MRRQNKILHRAPKKVEMTLLAGLSAGQDAALMGEMQHGNKDEMKWRDLITALSPIADEKE